MATQNQPMTTTPVSPEALRAQLLRPFPAITPRGILIVLTIILILVWSWRAARPSEINRVDGIFDALGAMADLIGRMVPPVFELVRGTTTTITVLGNPIELGWPVVV